MSLSIIWAVRLREGKGKELVWSKKSQPNSFNPPSRPKWSSLKCTLCWWMNKGEGTPCMEVVCLLWLPLWFGNFFCGYTFSLLISFFFNTFWGNRGGGDITFTQIWKKSYLWSVILLLLYWCIVKAMVSYERFYCCYWCTTSVTECEVGSVKLV